MTNKDMKDIMVDILMALGLTSSHSKFMRFINLQMEEMARITGTQIWYQGEENEEGLSGIRAQLEKAEKENERPQD